MIQKNIYKPRYKITFQSKNKIWPYKNSRLRRFFNIRGRKLIRRGFFKRYVIVFNNMKWTIARRYIKPHINRRSIIRYKYKDAFYTKQQLRHFYGKIKEDTFRKIFQTYVKNTTDRNKSFFATLEKRLDMFFFRMRLLPTIYACHQLIHHQGLLINGKIEKSPHALVKTGDIVSIQKKQWIPLFWFLYFRVYFRLYGKYILKKRQFNLLKRKTWLIFKSKSFKKPLFIKKHKQLHLFFYRLRYKFSLFLTKILARVHILMQKNNNKKFFNLAERVLLRLRLLHEKFVKFFISYKKYFRNFKYNEDSRFQKKFWWKNYYKEFYKLIGFTYSKCKALSYLWLLIRLEELRFYNSLFLTFKEETKEGVRDDVFSAIKDREKLLIDKYLLLKRKLNQEYSLFFRCRIKKGVLNSFLKHSIQQKKILPKRSPLAYFLINRRYKKKRRLQISRLKPIHLYIPKYIHYDFRTLRAVMIYSPLAEEVHYSFHCSLSKIQSFYKSLAI